MQMRPFEGVRKDVSMGLDDVSRETSPGDNAIHQRRRCGRTLPSIPVSVCQQSLTVENEADKQVQWDAEDVDDGGAQLFGHLGETGVGGETMSSRHLPNIHTTSLLTKRARSAIMEGQKTPTHPSKRQKASSWILPCRVMPPTPDSPREEPAEGEGTTFKEKSRTLLRRQRTPKAVLGPSHGYPYWVASLSPRPQVYITFLTF